MLEKYEKLFIFPQKLCGVYLPDFVPLTVGDVNIGFLFILAISSLQVYGVVLAGWSSNNKYALLGGLRAAAQLISYELAMGLSLLCVVILAGSLKLNVIVEAQNAL